MAYSSGGSSLSVRSGGRGLGGAVRRLGAAIGAVLVSMLAATAAQAQCTGPATPGLNLVPFAGGSSINALVSAINAANTVFLTQSTAFISSPPNPQPDQIGGGVWARGIGGEQTTKSTATSSYTIGGVPLAGNVTCQSSSQLTFGGVQIGTDVSSLNVDGWNLHVGSTLGYMGSTAKDTTAAGPLNPTGGTFSDDLQIPFVGAYAAATKGSFYLDGQARWLYFQNALSDAQNGLFSQHLDARGFAINGDIGYVYQLPHNWFIEPSAGFIWSKTTVDPLNVSGTFILANSPGLAPPATISISNLYSAIGRLSARVGTTFDAGYLILQPFGTASFFRDFRGDATATLTGRFDTLGIALPVSGTLATTGIGNFGQFGAGVAGQIKNTGWLGYIRADYRTGDNIQGWSVNGGVRYQFSPEMVRPLVVKEPEPETVAAVTPYNWTGFKVGAMLGADWGYTNWIFVANGAGTSPRFAGVLPGGFIGYDRQFGKWVVGVGGDMAWTNANGAAACPNGFFFTCQNQSNWLATATGRLGYTFWNDRVLSYVKAGGAFSNFTAKFSCNTDSQPTLFITLAGCPSNSVSKTNGGWTVGLGTEFGLTNDWTVRAETSYFNLGTDTYNLVAGPFAQTATVSHQGFTATIGVAYRFDFGAPPAPVVAKY